MRLKRKGFVGVCFADDAGCREHLKALNPNAEPLELTVRRRTYGIMTPPIRLHLEFTAPDGAEGPAANGVPRPASRP